MLAFLHLFEAHPEAKNKFKMFEDIPTDDLKTNEIFQNHAHRVVSVIRKIVGKLDEPSVYLNYLKILGGKHIMFDADVKYIKQMGYMFLSAIQPTLEKEVGIILYRFSNCLFKRCHFQAAWDEDTRDAWESLLVIVVETMEIAILEG